MRLQSRLFKGIQTWTAKLAHFYFWNVSGARYRRISPARHSDKTRKYHLIPMKWKNSWQVLTIAICISSPPDSNFTLRRNGTIGLHGPHHSLYTSSTGKDQHLIAETPKESNKFDEPKRLSSFNVRYDWSSSDVLISVWNFCPFAAIIKSVRLILSVFKEWFLFESNHFRPA